MVEEWSPPVAAFVRALALSSTSLASMGMAAERRGEPL